MDRQYKIGLFVLSLAFASIGLRDFPVRAETLEHGGGSASERSTVALADATDQSHVGTRQPGTRSPQRRVVPQVSVSNFHNEPWDFASQFESEHEAGPVAQTDDIAALGSMVRGTALVIETGGRRTASEIMADPAAQQARPFDPGFYRTGLQKPFRGNLPQAPGVLDIPQWPPAGPSTPKSGSGATPYSPQTPGISFDGATGPTETGAFPPDVMGEAGPTQFVVFINGRLRTFSKSTGIADGVLNINPDVFFSSVTTPPGANEVTFTSDPNVRYDRMSGRWFLTIIDVILNSVTGSITRANRILIAFTDAASNGVISGGTVFTFLQFTGQASPALFTDYPSLGVDANALYIGADMFSLAGAFQNVNAYVIPKSPLLTGTPATAWVFQNLISGSTGPFAPRGVDNYDPNNTGSTAVGYFIGVDFGTFGTLVARRVTNPGSTDTGNPPTMSANILISTTLTTSFPVKVPHLGNAGGNNGRLDALDDRLYAAHLRNGRLWTAHNIGVNSTGSTASQNRNAARWYEIQNLGTTPSVLQAGTLYDNSSPNDANQRNYWIPTIMVSGQGHSVLGCSIAGANERINAFTTGRLGGDALGTLRDGPGGSSLPGYTSSSTAYNPPGNPGGTGGRRWGDYSFISLDPNDDMTMWSTQEYCNGANTYGVRALQLFAPPPATPSSASPSTVAPLSSVDVVITGTSVSGSGFFDPGAGFANRISASVPGALGSTGTVTVNTVTYNNPTSVTLNLNTNGAAGDFRVTITNPDGQSVTSTSPILVVDPALPIQLISFTGTATSSSTVLLEWATLTETNNYGFEVQKSEELLAGYQSIPNCFIPGHGTTIVPHYYSYTDTTIPGTWYYRLKQIDLDGTINYTDGIMVDVVTAVSEGPVPSSFSLAQNYPNPFNPSTVIRYSLPERTSVKLEVYNTLGQLIAALVDGEQGAGHYEAAFQSDGLSSGVYVYRIQAGQFTALRKFLLLK